MRWAHRVGLSPHFCWFMSHFRWFASAWVDGWYPSVVFLMLWFPSRFRMFSIYFAELWISPWCQQNTANSWVVIACFGTLDWVWKIYENLRCDDDFNIINILKLSNNGTFQLPSEIFRGETGPESRYVGSLWSQALRLRKVYSRNLKIRSLVLWLWSGPGMVLVLFNSWDFHNPIETEHWRWNSGTSISLMGRSSTGKCVDVLAGCVTSEDIFHDTAGPDTFNTI